MSRPALADVALAHIRAAVLPHAKGRYILSVETEIPPQVRLRHCSQSWCGQACSSTTARHTGGGSNSEPADATVQVQELQRG